VLIILPQGSTRFCILIIIVLNYDNTGAIQIYVAAVRPEKDTALTYTEMIYCFFLNSFALYNSCIADKKKEIHLQQGFPII